ALLADITPPTLRGAAYGLRQALDSVGAFIGPLLAALFLFWFSDNLEAAMWVAVVPAFIAVALLMVYVREPEHAASTDRVKAPLSLQDMKRLPLRFWMVALLGALFTLTRFSEAFLVLRAENVGLALGFVPLVMVAMNVGYALFAYPAGAAADRLSRRALLIIGLLFLIAADVMLALASGATAVFAGAALWGLHMAFTQGLLSKLVADHAPSALRGTAFGIFNLVVGVSLLLASVIAGGLWAALGPAFTFAAGAGFALLTMLGLLFAR
ncbi:MAG: MFS transporter, partial [Acidihalobacter sp.]